jgi:DNA (cytosine-5)-methyltransferase 1
MLPRASTGGSDCHDTSDSLMTDNDKHLNYRRSSDGKKILREIILRDGRTVQSQQPRISKDSCDDLAAEFEASWIRSVNCPTFRARSFSRAMKIADMFSGCGAMTLGAVEACRALGLIAGPVFAMDQDPTAIKTYSRNFPSAHCVTGNIEKLLSLPLGSKISSSERQLRRHVAKPDILLGGPPCQGHSDLNNHSRRHDPKNALMLTMTRFAEIFEPEHIIIENVPGVLHDYGRVVDRTRRALERLGYFTDCSVVNLSRLGIPQTRRRFILVASTSEIQIDALLKTHYCEKRSLRWAISDLLKPDSPSSFDEPSNISKDNAERIAYLFKNKIYDLPDKRRPNCHRTKEHTYKSIYGRLHWDKPAQTITTGFTSMGQGRFVHPSRRRTLTPHEAARIQFIPDFFSFEGIGRRKTVEMIGNAVPPKLICALALELMR